jgi:putative spermidine/putrescine transport system substrate-binding protein
MDPASKKFGAEIANVSPTNYAKIKAMVEAKAVEWDLVDVGGQFIYQGRDQGLLEKMDFSVIDASKTRQVVGDRLRCLHEHRRDGDRVQHEELPEGKAPTSWKDFWNVKDYPGAVRCTVASITTTKRR